MSARDLPRDRTTTATTSLLVAAAVVIAGISGYLAGDAGFPMEPAILLALAAAAAAFGAIRLHGRQMSEPLGLSMDGWRAFRRELHRARRNEQPLALVRLSGVGDGTLAGRRRRVVAVRRALRRIDLAWAHADDVIVLLPETDGPTARSVVNRVVGREQALAGSIATIAAFPADGLTSTALLARLREAPVGPLPETAPAPIPVGAAAVPSTYAVGGTGEVASLDGAASVGAVSFTAAGFEGSRRERRGRAVAVGGREGMA